jgi:hypothetical protein
MNKGVITFALLLLVVGASFPVSISIPSITSTHPLQGTKTPATTPITPISFSKAFTKIEHDCLEIKEINNFTTITAKYFVIGFTTLQYLPVRCELIYNVYCKNGNEEIRYHNKSVTDFVLYLRDPQRSPKTKIWEFNQMGIGFSNMTRGEWEIDIYADNKLIGHDYGNLSD